MMAVIYFSDQLNFFERGFISSISEKLIKEGYADGIAEELAKGNIVTDVSGCDDRLLQKYFISKMKKCPNTIVLGSSRVRFINGSMVQDSTLINNGVSSASLEDLVAIYSLYENKGCEIKKIIIGVDPWILNDNNTYDNTGINSRNAKKYFTNKITSNNEIKDAENFLLRNFRYHLYQSHLLNIPL